MSVPALLLRATVPLDSARRTAFRAALRVPYLSTALSRRDARVAVVATAHALAAFVLAVLCPSLLFVLGPVVLGVGHVASDVRYLVLRRSVARSIATLAWTFCLALIGVRILDATRVIAEGTVDGLEIGVTAIWVTCGLVIGSAEGRARWRAAAAIPVVGALAALSLMHPVAFRLVFLHAHNVIALGIWVSLFRRRKSALALPLAVIGLGALLLASGATWEVTLHHGLASSFGLHVLQAADWIAPGLRADFAVGLTSAYVFLQSIHYAVWLYLVPQDDQRREASSPFRQTARSLIGDFGPVWLLLVAAGALVVIALAFRNPVGVRNTYLGFAMFHGYLELALFAYLWARGLGRTASSA